MAVEYSIGYLERLDLSRAGLCIQLFLSSKYNHSKYPIECSTEYLIGCLKWLYLQLGSVYNSPNYTLEYFSAVWECLDHFAHLKISHAARLDYSSESRRTYASLVTLSTARLCIQLHVFQKSKQLCILNTEWVMSHTWMSHVSYVNESCLIFEWAMSFLSKYPRNSKYRMSHVSYVGESCLIFEWVMSILFKYPRYSKHPIDRKHLFEHRAVLLKNACLDSLRNTYILRMSHVSHVNESCRTCEWVV
jgi:hypothetical protein